MKEVLVLRELECIKAIAHPKRIDILKRFEKEPLSAKQLSEILNEPHAKINYHIKALYNVGVLELVEEKVKSGIVEKYYYPSARNIVIGNDILDFTFEKTGERKTKNISKFEDITQSFFTSIENDLVAENKIINYKNINFTESEIEELNKVLELKVAEILSKKGNNVGITYDMSILIVPSLQKEYNI